MKTHLRETSVRVFGGPPGWPLGLGSAMLSERNIRVECGRQVREDGRDKVDSNGKLHFDNGGFNVVEGSCVREDE